jgi:putative FmdB family regulatory protein
MYMPAATYSCTGCRAKFQLIGINTKADPKSCPYCGKDAIEPANITLC